MSTQSHVRGASRTVGTATATIAPKEDLQPWYWIGGLTLVLVYAYANSLADVVAAWGSPQYSHGYIIPLFAMVLLWIRREPIGEVPASHRWWGVGLVAAALVARLISSHYVTFIFDRVSFIPCVAGVFVMIGGWRALRWAWPPILFLIFMYPLPDVLVTNVLNRMQSVATGGSLFAMQTLGVEAYREGNKIMMDQVQLGVVDACSGLRMLTIFVAFSVAVSMLIPNRPKWERMVIIVSAVPIALLVNMVRITVTGLLYNLHVDVAIADFVFHDAAGWVMMPMALGLLYLEYQILVRLVLEEAPADILSANLSPVPAGVVSKGKSRRRRR